MKLSPTDKIQHNIKLGHNHDISISNEGQYNPLVKTCRVCEQMLNLD